MSFAQNIWKGVKQFSFEEFFSGQTPNQTINNLRL